MNTNNNVYTFVYSAVIVIVVAAVLAYVSTALKPRQDANIKAETISQMLAAARYSTKEELAAVNNEAILDKYAGSIIEAFIIDAQGNKISELNTSRSDIQLADDLKPRNKAIKAGKDVELPVYIFNNGTTVVPVYGAGLWAAVWGYIAIGADGKTICGAYFDHEQETPGLGAKIKDDPDFRAQFIGKTVNFNANPVFGIVKNASADNQVDAITGATMTSKGLDAAIACWLEAYKPYFMGVQEAASSCASTENTEG